MVKPDPHDFRCVKTPQNNAGFSYAEVQTYMSELYEFYWEKDEQLRDLLNGIADGKVTTKELIGSDKPFAEILDKMCEFYFLAKYEENYGDISHPVSMHTLNAK